MRRLLYLGLAVAALSLVPVGIISCQERRPVTKAPAPANDMALVERVNASRREYQQALESLREYYGKHGDVERQRWVEEELLSYHRISKRAYRLDLDVPPPTLRPEHNIPEANELFRRAMTFKDKGFGGTRDDNNRRAELLFQQLLGTYPQCDKIDDAAYELGLIYEDRPFEQYRRAATYYERCFQWNSNTSTDARLRAARLYDRVLQDRGRATQLYTDVTKYDADQKRVDEAQKRLRELGSNPPGR
jgi:hypothetical protein